MPETTLIYAAHEYTVSNLQFAYSVHDDEIILENLNHSKKLLSEGNITLPTVLSLEKRINLFLLENRPEFAKAKPDLEWFTELRKRKDSA